MLRSWHNFLFVAFDPSGLVTVDKPPLALWVQAASAKLFGFTPLSLLLPEAIAGALAVGALYLVLQPRLGTGAAFGGALAMAVFPSFVAVSRENGVDTVLILLLVLACAAALRACDTGRSARSSSAACSSGSPSTPRRSPPISSCQASPPAISSARPAPFAAASCRSGWPAWHARRVLRLDRPRRTRPPPPSARTWAAPPTTPSSGSRSPTTASAASRGRSAGPTAPPPAPAPRALRAPARRQRSGQARGYAVEPAVHVARGPRDAQTDRHRRTGTLRHPLRRAAQRPAPVRRGPRRSGWLAAAVRALRRARARVATDRRRVASAARTSRPPRRAARAGGLTSTVRAWRASSCSAAGFSSRLSCSASPRASFTPTTSPRSRPQPAPWPALAPSRSHSSPAGAGVRSAWRSPPCAIVTTVLAQAVLLHRERYMQWFVPVLVIGAGVGLGAYALLTLRRQASDGPVPPLARRSPIDSPPQRCSPSWPSCSSRPPPTPPPPGSCPPTARSPPPGHATSPATARMGSTPKTSPWTPRCPRTSPRTAPARAGRCSPSPPTPPRP